MSYTLSHGRIDASSNGDTSMQCQLCHKNITHLSVSQREQHYEEHFNEQPEASSSKRPESPKAGQSKPKLNTGSAHKFKPPTARLEKGKDRFWYPAQTADPPSNFTPGLILVLKKHLNKSHTNGYTRRAVLCTERAVLVNREFFDAGWGCGYRNFMMACVSLMDQDLQPMYFPLLDHPIPPGVRNLQQWIEDAWNAGFDPEGAKQLKSLVGSRKWIGTSDLFAAFTFRGIPATLIDFDLKENQRGADLLTDWVVEYFRSDGLVDKDKVLVEQRPKSINDVLFGASAVTVTSRMPLILQHAGHSRTIVGYEYSKKGSVNLLEFDPSKLPKKGLRRMGLDAFAAMPRRHDDNGSSSPSTKRPATSHNCPIPLKRSRVDNEPSPEQDDDDEIQIISVNIRNENVVPKPNKTTDEMSTKDVLQFFRLDPKKLEKKKAYQILYFPMSAPLSESERERMRDTSLFCQQIS